MLWLNFSWGCFGDYAKFQIEQVLEKPANLLEILHAVLQGLAGTGMRVSHDRHFLRSLVDRVFEIDHGEMRPYEGDYEYYLHKTGRDHRMV